MRSEFGTWGANLDDDTFAKALTALGALGETAINGTPASLTEELQSRFMPGPGERFTEPRRWEPPAGRPWREMPDPAMLAKAWDGLLQLLRDAYPPPEPDRPRPPMARLQIDASPQRDGLKLQPFLCRAAAGTVLHFATDWMSPDTDWQWPLRVSFAGSSARIRREELGGTNWEGQLFRVAAASPSEEFSDLLLVERPADLDSPSGGVDLRLDTNCVIVLARSGVPWRRLVPEVQNLAARVRASGVAFVTEPAKERRTLITELVRNLSHDEPIDVALAHATEAIGLDRPLVFAHQQLLRASRITHRARVLSQRLRRAVIAREEAPAPELLLGAARDREVSLAVAELRTVTDSLEATPPSDVFVFESGPATDVASHVDRAEALIAELPPDEATRERSIVAEVFDASEPILASQSHGFRAGRPHVIEVGIGWPEGGQVGAAVPFPSEELPESDRPHRLMVVLAPLAPWGREPLTAWIELPRFGASTTCSFPIGVVPEDTERLRFRISILFRNRILQTAILSGPVLDDRSEEPLGSGQITIHVEASLRPGLGGLDGRRRFDLSLLFNHLDEDTSAVQTVAGERVDLTIPPNLGAVTTFVQDRLSGVANNVQGFTTLTSLEATKLMVDLARHGTILRDNLFGDSYDTVRDVKRIQLVSFNPNDVVPIEFVYDRPSPAETAEVCPNAIARLPDGECGDDCPGGDALPNPIVCPLAFWCTTKVIERRAKDLPPTGTWVQRDPIPGADRLSILRSALFGGSTKVDKVDPAGRQRIATTLGTVIGSPTPQADTWANWQATVVQATPSLLVMLPHTGSNDIQIGTLEIGDDTQSLDFLGEDHVCPEGALAPVVLLLGCNTAMTTMPFQSAAVKFRKLGAAVTVGTIATIVGRHAVPMADALIESLHDLTDDGDETTLGEVVRAARRNLLSRGLVIGLALTAYGDADWRIVS